MKAVRSVLEYLKGIGVQHVFGIPAGSVNAFFDELYDMPEITPIITKHEGAASYMAAAYAKYSDQLSVCIGSSGPGGTNLVTGAANAMREHLPILFLTGAVPVSTEGLNASQELDADPIYHSVTKYSVTVRDSKDLLKEIIKATKIAVSGVPGPVHIAMPIDVQQGPCGNEEIPTILVREEVIPNLDMIKQAAKELVERKSGYIFVGQGVRNSVDLLFELAEMLEWPIMTTPVAKGFVRQDHPLSAGVFGFAATEQATSLINDGDGKSLLIIGSSLGETATNNYNGSLTDGRFTVQMDFDETVFNRKYPIDIPILGDIQLSLSALIEELKALGITRKEMAFNRKDNVQSHEDYTTKNVLLQLQSYLPSSTRYTIDIGEFMAYVIHDMDVLEYSTFDINVHFGAMGSGIGSAIGAKLAEPDRPTVAITGDGCFFMHGMEILTAKEYNIPVLFVVMNNARLGMVYHGHNLQYKRVHPTFAQEPINIAAMAAAMNIPSVRIEEMGDLNEEVINSLLQMNGPAVLEISLVDNSIPPMGDRVKFLSSFGK